MHPTLTRAMLLATASRAAPQSLIHVTITQTTQPTATVADRP